MFLVVLSLTALPKMPLLLLAAVAAAWPRVILSRSGKAAVAARGRPSGATTARRPSPDKVESLLAVDPMELEVGYGLIRLVDASRAATCWTASA